MDCAGVHQVRGRVADHGLDADNRRPCRLRLRLGHGGLDGGDVLAGFDGKRLPAVGVVTLEHVLSERDLGVVLDGDAVVVPEQDEVAQLLGAGERGRLGGHTLLQAAVAGDDVDVVVEGRLAGGGVGVEQATFTSRSHRHAHCGSEALAERAGGDLDVFGVVVLRVARGLRTPGAQVLQVLQLQAEAAEVQLHILRERGVAVGQHEAVAAHPILVGRVHVHHALEQGVGQWREAHGGARVSGTAVFHRVGGEHPGRVNGAGVGLGPILRVVALGHCLQFRGQRHGVLAFFKVAQKHIAYRRLRSHPILDSLTRVGWGYHRPKV